MEQTYCNNNEGNNGVEPQLLDGSMTAPSLAAKTITANKAASSDQINARLHVDDIPSNRAVTKKHATVLLV